MEKVKYHVNPKTLRPGKCSAKFKCKYQSPEGQNPPHFNTKEEAQKVKEAIARATSVEEVRRLERQLKEGYLPSLEGVGA